MTIREATRQYQAFLEAVRVNPQADELQRELDDARRAMVVAWLEHVAVL